jgi:hypothetical protein
MSRRIREALRQMAAAVHFVRAAPTIGIGIGALSYYDSAYACTDMTREGSYLTQSYSTALAVDANREPTQDFLVIYGCATMQMGVGVYKVSFTGIANLLSAGGGVLSNQVYNGGTNTTTVDLTFSAVTTAATALLFSNTQRTGASATGTGVTGITMYRPGYSAASGMFTTEFIQAMHKVDILRTMDLTKTNNNSDTVWADRPLPAWKGVSDGKLSWEHCVTLANTCQRDLWINVPAKADDTYIANLANLFKYGSDGVNPYTSVQSNPIYPPLNSNLAIYLEYGNETWNSGAAFYCYGWTFTLANAYIGTTHPVNYDGQMADVSSQYVIRYRWHAFRSAQISLAFRAVFGDAAMLSQVRPVLESQQGNGNQILSIMLAFLEGLYSTARGATTPPIAQSHLVGDLFYGGGGSAYYGSTFYPTANDETTKAAFFAGFPSPTSIPNFKLDKILTKAYGLKQVAYEGGTNGCEGGNTAYSPEYNQDPRTGQVMRLVQQLWDQVGGDELVYYSYAGAGTNWAFINTVNRTTVSDTGAVKIQALDAIKATSKPAPTFGTLAPCNAALRALPASDIYASNPFNGDYDNATYRLVTNSFAMVPFRSVGVGNYTLTLTVYASSGSCSVRVYVNGVSAGLISIPDANIHTSRQTTSLPVTLPDGVSVVRVMLITGAVFLSNIILA